MSNSLRDQLLKVGLVNTSQKRTVEQQLRRQAKTNPHAKTESQLAKEAAEASRLAQLEKNKLQNQKLQEQRDRKERKAQIKLLLTQNRQNKNHAQIPYRFVVGKKVKNIYATEDQHKDLMEGRLAIAYFAEISYIIPESIANKIVAIDPTVFVHISKPSASTSSQTASSADSAYADYKVPDDLIW